MCRTVDECAYTVIDMEKELDGFVQDPRGWIARQAGEHGLTTLLAHADDGVLWGTVSGGELHLSHKAFPDVSPELELVTLQQARVFGPESELLIWRDGGGSWCARILRDEPGPGTAWRFDEAQLLWGDHQEGEPVEGFALVAEGQEGRRHAVPVPQGGIPFARSGYHPLRLSVRHYLEDDGDGLLVVVHSRLTGLSAREQEESNG